MEKFRQMFNRAQLENAEVAMLRVFDSDGMGALRKLMFNPCWDL